MVRGFKKGKLSRNRLSHMLRDRLVLRVYDNVELNGHGAWEMSSRERKKTIHTAT